MISASSAPQRMPMRSPRSSTCLILAAASRAAAMSTVTSSPAKGGLWSETAIKAAKGFTVSARKNLAEQGALDVRRPIRIIGEPLDSAEKAMRDTGTAPAPGRTSKIIHFQRHGQGFHNLICDMMRDHGLPIDFDSSDPKLNPCVREELLDPPLTELGRRQCSGQRFGCAMLSPELVIASPMLRCIQTAKLSFGDHLDVPWVAHEGCREELGLLVGNKRRSLSEISADYPEIDYSAMEEYEADVLWEEYGDERRETVLEKSERIYKFLTEYVMNRPEREIAIVCHSAYLFTLLNAVMDVEDEELRSWFLTSEVRSLRMEFELPENSSDDSFMRVVG